MAKVTSKHQVSMLIERPPAGDVIRIVRPDGPVIALDQRSELWLFDQATERNRKRSAMLPHEQSQDRGWIREDLYGCGPF